MATQKIKAIFEIKDHAGMPVTTASLALLDFKTKTKVGAPVSASTTGKYVGLYEVLDIAPGEYFSQVTDTRGTVIHTLSCPIGIQEAPDVQERQITFPNVELRYVPTPPISEAGVLKLKAVPLDPTAQYAVKWTVAGPPKGPGNGTVYGDDVPEALWNPPNLTGKGNVAFTVKVELRETTPGGHVVEAAEKIEVAEKAYSPATVFDAAKDMALLMKHNIDSKFDELSRSVSAAAQRVAPGGMALDVRLQRTQTTPSDDQALWIAVRNRTEAINFNRFNEFINRVLCVSPSTDTTGVGATPVLQRQVAELLPNIHGVGAYDVLRTAAQVFLIAECGVALPMAAAPGAPAVPTVTPPRDPITGAPTFPVDPATGLPVLDIPGEADRLGRPITYPQATRLLTQYLGSTSRLPYLQTVVDSLFPRGNQQDVSPFCFGLLRTRFSAPCLLELIWSYWHEEGMLVQTMNAISRRFQNIRGPAPSDPLAQLELDPLRPLNNLIWGFLQDEQHRLTVVRRAYEYDHHYSLKLFGKAVPELRPADSRSKFLEAFHNLLHRCSIFYQQADDTTVVPDGFPVLNALKEVHLLLSEGAHNQYGDLPWTARAEMLVQQWLLARQEFRDFLPSRLMVAYPEPWMHRVDSMKRLQGWTDISVMHFSNLGRFGEQLLLSIRFGNWSTIFNAADAAAFAHYWRQEVQGYIHAYRAVTGVDLMAEPVNSTVPSVLLRQRLSGERANR